MLQDVFSHATAVFIRFSKPAAIITANHPNVDTSEWLPQRHIHSNKTHGSKPEGTVLQGHQTS